MTCVLFRRYQSSYLSSKRIYNQAMDTRPCSRTSKQRVWWKRKKLTANRLKSQETVPNLFWTSLVDPRTCPSRYLEARTTPQHWKSCPCSQDERKKCSLAKLRSRKLEQATAVLEFWLLEIDRRGEIVEAAQSGRGPMCVRACVRVCKFRASAED